MTPSRRGSTAYPGENVSIGLVHWPVLDRAGTTVVTNVTNFDIHDIARVATTYGLHRYYIVNRLEEQLMFVHRVLDHWKVGQGSQLNPKRRTALNSLATAKTVDEILSEFREKPLVIATAARDISHPPVWSFQKLKKHIFDQPERPVLILFGTGFGLHQDLLDQCDGLLEPIKSVCPEDYRHLSVRSAVSICLDRLLSKW